ncbi:MAG: pentapeptide repeat protein [Caulobacter sp.]|nr:pentapeptide repeat protein [Caulobacter sp.]
MLTGYSRSAAGGGATAGRSNDGRIGQAIDAHERYARGEPGGMRAIMRGLQLPAADFAGRLLSEADFSNCNLAGARLGAITAERTVFYCADLRGVDLSDANLNGADLRGASLRAADLTGALLDGADLRKAILTKLDLSGGHQIAPTTTTGEVAVDFSDASMKGARLGGARLENASFKGAVLHGADFEGARLDGADFAGAVLTGVSLEQLKLSRVALRDCVTDPDKFAFDALPSIRAVLEIAEKWAATNGKVGQPARLDRADLRPLAGQLAGVRLTAASMVDVQAIGVDFSRAQLQGANFAGADLRDVDFTDADLRGARFGGARLRGAIFTRADLRPLPLANGQGRPTDFVGANYNPAALMDAVMS